MKSHFNYKIPDRKRNTELRCTQEYRLKQRSRLETTRAVITLLHASAKTQQEVKKTPAPIPVANESKPLAAAIKKNKNKKSRHESLQRKRNKQNVIASLFLFLTLGRLIQSAEAKPIYANQTKISSDLDHSFNSYKAFAFTAPPVAQNIILRPVLNPIVDPLINQTPVPSLTSTFTYDEVDANACTISRLNRFNLDGVKIIDFWGEGRIVDRDIVTGFPNAYNVNYQHQKISNGVNRGGVIPNYIPTRSYDYCSIEQFVEDDTFQYATLMGAPITEEIAEEMYRVVMKSDVARILFYGNHAAYTQKLQAASQDDFIYMQHSSQYVNQLDSVFRTVTIRPINVMVPIKQVMKDLATKLIRKEFNSAASILIDIDHYCHQNYSKSSTIIEDVKKLMNNNVDIAPLLTEISKKSNSSTVNKIVNTFDLGIKKSAMRLS